MKIIFSLVSFLCIGFCMSCLKNDVTFDYTGIEPVVTVPNSNWPVAPFPADDSVFDAASTSAEMYLYARLSFQRPQGADLQINFMKDVTLIEEYNNKWKQHYVLLPDDAYQVPNLQLTIPAGSIDAYIPIRIYPDKLDPAISYILPYTITDADGYTVASNYKSMLYTLKVQ